MAGGDPAPVLVVGAGPTGLATACELYRHGVSCRIIDVLPERTTESRATGIQSRTLEVFQDMGVLDEVLDRGLHQTRVVFYEDGSPLVRISTDDADTPFPFMVGLAQSDTEAILDTQLQSLGGRVERGVRLACYEAHDDHIDATLLFPDGHWEELRFEHIVGCDGAHSVVRRGLLDRLAGETYPESFILCDARCDAGLPVEEIALHVSDHGFVFLQPLPDGFIRFFVSIDPGEEPPLTKETFERMGPERMGREVHIESTGWMSRFRVHHRLAPRYREGRVFLAGDAAHIHSPIGGHGMNLGIQDGYNLAWKLALVLRGHGRPELLDSYEPERHPIAKSVLTETDLNTRMALWRHPVAKEARRAMLGLVERLAPVRRSMLLSAMELAYNYRQSPIVNEKHGSVLGTHLSADADSEAPTLGEWRRFEHAPRAGDRIPDVALPGGGSLFETLCRTQHTLLLFDGRAATSGGYANLAAIAGQVRERWGDLVAVQVVVPHDRAPDGLNGDTSVVLDPEGAVHARYGAGAECLYLIRPDGYVGFRSQPADQEALAAHLERCLG